ncbi:MAG: SusC/RagA family TonB-linked outer membrane protein, partial [Tannerella sp.]|nr:SusC/RagA family TonB-linked outer membrane protein [Tannerella sp.]
MTNQVLIGTVALLMCAAPVTVAYAKVPEVNVSLPQQQGRTVTITVRDPSGPLIGVNVIVKGTTNGNITDTKGKVTLENVPATGILQISYVGYKTQNVAVRNRSNIMVNLSEDSEKLSEVVVVGYGTQQKKDITGSVAVVNTQELQEAPVATFAEALQGKASGVYIMSSGAPGASTTIRIRGVSSVNGADPLIVVDGVSDVDIDSVDPNDIASIQVLKDASATAIYGAKGANGVIIITTKQGDKDGKVRISYNGYVGWATMANNGYNLMNATEYMNFVAQGMINTRDVLHLKPAPNAQFGALNAQDKLTMPYAIIPAGYSEQDIINRWGSVANWVASYKPDGAHSWARSATAQMLADGYSQAEADKGTDWYDLITRTGFNQNHQLSILGGTKKGQYSLSLGYTSREGTVKASYFDRYSLRLNATYNPTKYLSLGTNTNLAAMEFGGERGSQGDDNLFAKTYNIQAWVPVYNVGGDFAGPNASGGGRDQSGVAAIDDQERDWNKVFRGQSALFAEIKNLPFVPGLTLRTQFNTRLSGTWYSQFTPINIMYNPEGASTNYHEEQARWYLDWQWTNTATYAHKFGEDHDLTVVIGTDAFKNGLGQYLEAWRREYTFENQPLTQTIGNGSASNLGNDGYFNGKTTMFGYFGRADYNFKDKYLATFAIRRDASSKFSPKNRWATFPSMSVGWRISGENFMGFSKNWLDDLKLRVGYGTSGNSNIGSYNWATQYATGSQYNYSMIGSDNGTNVGYGPSNIGDMNAKWETVRSLNIGFDATALNQRLTGSFEWYWRKTTDMLVPANWS